MGRCFRWMDGHDVHDLGGLSARKVVDTGFFALLGGRLKDNISLPSCIINHALP